VLKRITLKQACVSSRANLTVRDAILLAQLDMRKDGYLGDGKIRGASESG